MINIFNQIETKFRQEISVMKIKIMIVKGRDLVGEEPEHQRQYFVRDEVLEQVNKFKYLGG